MADIPIKVGDRVKVVDPKSEYAHYIGRVKEIVELTNDETGEIIVTKAIVTCNTGHVTFTFSVPLSGLTAHG